MAPAGDTSIDTIAADRSNCGRGGSRICEILAFNKALSADDRQFLQDCLKHKWLGLGSKRHAAKELDSLVVRQGATYRNKDSQVSLSAAAFSGGGTVDFEKASVTYKLDVGDSGSKAAAATFTGDLAIGAGAEIALDVVSSNACDKVQVGGKFLQEGPVTLSLNISGHRPRPYGEFPIVAASVLSGVDLEKWTVELPDDLNLSVELFVRDEEVFMTVAPPGLMLILK